MGHHCHGWGITDVSGVSLTRTGAQRAEQEGWVRRRNGALFLCGICRYLPTRDLRDARYLPTRALRDPRYAHSVCQHVMPGTDMACRGWYRYCPGVW
eukprot:2815491-Rhodomonas_salina.3